MVVTVTIMIVTSSITLATSPSVKESITIDRNKIEKSEVHLTVLCMLLEYHFHLKFLEPAFLFSILKTVYRI